MSFSATIWLNCAFHQRDVARDQIRIAPEAGLAGDDGTIDGGADEEVILEGVLQGGRLVRQGRA